VDDEPHTAARKNIEPSLKIRSRKSESFFRNAGAMWQSLHPQFDGEIQLV
jgi:hypothetical protein